MVVVDARVVDSTHLELAKPIDAPSGGNALVSLAVPGETDDERADWLKASEPGLAADYGNSEPEYSVDMVKEPNPDFEG